MRKGKLTQLEQLINNGSPCAHDGCGKGKLPCNYCGRIAMRGNVLIQNRTGYVHLERLNSTNKKEHLKLKEADQELATIKLWIAPTITF